MEEHTESCLEMALRGLPPEKVQQVMDFANYLRSKYAPQTPEAGSAAAILDALHRVGPLQFAPRELESLLDEIQTMRDMETETGEQLST